MSTEGTSRRVLLILATALAFVSGAVYAEVTLSGECGTTVRVMFIPEVWSLETELTLVCETEAWCVEAETTFEDEDWKQQSLSAECTLDWLEIESKARFEPSKDRFRDWITKIETVCGSLMMTLISKLTRTTDWLIFESDYECDTVEIETSFRMRAPTGDCRLLFYDASLDLAFTWCEADVDVGIALDDDDLDEITVELSDLPLTRFPWATLDFELTFETDEKSFSFDPSLSLDSDCALGDLELEFEVEALHEPEIYPLSIVEVALDWEIEPWKMEVTAILNPDDWIDDAYWLEVNAEAELDLAPCGEVALEFSSLWTMTTQGEFTAALSYAPTDRLSLGLEFTVDTLDKRLETLAMTTQVAW